MDIDKSNMKVPHNNNYRVADLFYEVSRNKDLAVYTLSDSPRRGLVCIRDVYLEIADTTEYLFAKECFLSWKHWKAVANSSALSSYVEEWREELAVKVRSEGAKSMIDAAAGGNATAAKWMVEEGWTKGNKVGRPKKDNSEREERISKEVKKNVVSDIERMRELKR